MKNNLLKGEKHYNIQEVFDAIGEEALALNAMPRDGEKDEIVFDGFRVYKHSLRYMTFAQKGTVCCKCGRKGAYFTLDKERADYDGDKRHFNLYAEDDTLITKDHILAKSKGGQNKVTNMQTMCTICNFIKGSYTEEEVEAHGLVWGIPLKIQLRNMKKGGAENAGKR